MRNKKGFDVVFSPLVFWILALIGLALFLVLVFVLRGKGAGAIDFIKNLFAFR